MESTRYFLEIGYKGTRYSGSQVQENAHSIQYEVEKAFAVIQREKISFTGSSRTDAGVHALQNFFHFDYNGIINERFIYKMNSILPADIVVKNIEAVDTNSHCRFDARSREYHYHVYQEKNPLLDDRAYYLPYPLDLDLLHEAATIIKTVNDFTSFAKRNSQVNTFECQIQKSEWIRVDDMFIYKVKANRFLRGMVRGLTGTMLLVGRKKISIAEFKEIIEAKDCREAEFSVPAKGLFLVEVEY